MKTHIRFWSYLAYFFSELEKFRTKVVEKIKITHFKFTTFFFENRAVYDIMWKSTVERGKPQMTIRRMRNARWITKATNTHSEYVTLTPFQPQQWLQEHASLSRYMNITSISEFKSTWSSTIYILILHSFLVSFVKWIQNQICYLLRFSLYFCHS